MKLSTGMIGTLLFTAVATAAFVWMAKRPVVDGNAIIFGMPASSAVEKKMTEAAAPTNAATMKTGTLTSEVEPAAKAAEIEATPAASVELVTPASTEMDIKTEEMPAAN